MFCVFKWQFDEWECIATVSTIAEAIDVRDTAFDDTFEAAFDRWEFHAIPSRIDADTTAIIRDDEPDNVWAAFAIHEVSFPTI